MRGSTKVFIATAYGYLAHTLYDVWGRATASEFIDVLLAFGVIGLGIDIMAVAYMESSVGESNDPRESSCSHQPWVRKANPMFWLMRGFWRYCGFMATYVPKLWRRFISFLDKIFD